MYVQHQDVRLFELYRGKVDNHNETTINPEEITNIDKVLAEVEEMNYGVWMEDRMGYLVDKAHDLIKEG